MKTGRCVVAEWADFKPRGKKKHAMSCMEFDAMCDQFYSKDLHYFDTVGLALPLHSIHVMFTHRSCRVVLEPAGICGRSGPMGAPLHPPRPTSPTHRPSAVRARKRMGRHPKRTAYNQKGGARNITCFCSGVSRRSNSMVPLLVAWLELVE